MAEITHGRNRWRDRGKPRRYRTDHTCQEKRRFSDEIQAKAVGMIELEENCGNGKRLWVYPCHHCNGWHLTSKNGGERYLVPDPRRDAARARRTG
jgi:hypothetical protein